MRNWLCLALCAVFAAHSATRNKLVVPCTVCSVCCTQSTRNQFRTPIRCGERYVCISIFSVFPLFPLYLLHFPCITFPFPLYFLPIPSSACCAASATTTSSWPVGASRYRRSFCHSNVNMGLHNGR